MKTDPQTIQRCLAETRDFAIQMMQNAAYIQKELPSLKMSDDLRTSIKELCDELIRTKHDLMQEIFEASEWLESDPDRFDLWKELTRPWILDVIMSINECVEAVQEAVKNGSASPLVSFLVMESAANILNTAPALPEVSEEETKSEPDDIEEDGEQDDDEDDHDPNCYAFYTEDSYPVGILIAAIRRLMARPELTAETTGDLKVFLFAMERLPLPLETRGEVVAFEKQCAQWQKEKLHCVEQLPEIDIDHIVLVWDADYEGHEISELYARIVIRCGEREIYRGPSSWEYYDYFIDACKVTMTPLGSPVDPEVNIRAARSPDSTSGICRVGLPGRLCISASVRRTKPVFAANGRSRF